MKKLSKALLALCLSALLLCTTLVPAFAAPAAVKALKVSATTLDSVTLKWSKTAGAASYQLQQYSAKQWKTIATTKGRAYTVSGLSFGVTYVFRVRAYGDGGYGGFSPAVKTTTGPAAVKNLKAAKTTATAVKLTWSASAEATGYRVQLYRDKQWVTVVKATKKTAAKVGNLAAGVNNAVRVLPFTKKDGKVAFGLPTALKFKTPMLPKPTGLKATAVTSIAVKLTWNAVAGATSYVIYRVSGSTQKAVAKSTTTEALVKKLTPGTDYFFAARAVSNLSGDSYASLFSDNLLVRTAPSKVGGVKAANVTDTTITLTWKAVNSADGYQIWARSGVDTKWNYIGATDQTRYEIEGLLKSTSYQFRIRAYHTANGGQTCGVFSKVLKTATLTNGVGNFTATGVTINSVSLSWSVLSDATGYTLEQSTNGTTFTPVTAAQTTANGTVSVTVTGLAANTTYVFRVTPNSGSQVGVASMLSVQTAPGQTTGLAATEIAGGVRLTWTATPGATGYEISSNVNAAGWKSVASTTNTSYVLDGLDTTKTYQFRVTPYYTLNGVKQYGTPSAVVSAKALPAAVTGLTMTKVDTTSFTAQWTVNSAASGYALYLSEDYGSPKKLSVTPRISGSTATATISGLSNGTSYTLNVCAVVNGTESAPAVLQVKTTSPKVTGLSGTAISASRISLSWNAAKGAERYEVQRLNGSDYQTITTTSSMPYTVTGLSAGTSYTFRVRAVSGTAQYGAWSDTVTVKTNDAAPEQPTVAAPANVNAVDSSTASNSSITVTWSSVSGATGYEVWINSGTWRKLDTVVSTSYTANNLSANTTYQFRVRTVKNGVYSDYSSTVSAKTAASSTPVTSLSAPTGLTAVDSSNGTSFSITLNWNEVANAANYEVWINSGSWQKLGTTPNKAYTATGLAAGTTYQFRVRAVNGGVTSEYSATVSAKTAAGASSEHGTSSTPLKNLTVALSSNGKMFTIAWDDISSAVYAIDIWNPQTNAWVSTGSARYDAKYLVDVSTMELGAKYTAGSDYASNISWNAASGATGYEVRSEVVKGIEEWIDPVKTSSTGATLRLAPNAEQRVRISALGTVKFRIYALNAYNESQTLAYSEYSPRAYIGYQDLTFKTPAAAALSGSAGNGLKEAYTLMMLQAINNTRYETDTVTVNASSHMTAAPVNYKVTALFIPVPDSLIQEALEDMDTSQDVTSSCRYPNGCNTAGTATLTSVTDGEAPVTTTKTSYLNTSIVPTSGVSYLYDQHNLGAFGNGIQSVTATTAGDGSTTVTVVLKKESVSAKSDAKYHSGFTQSFANDKDVLTKDFGENYNSNLGTTTITAKINKNYTLDSLKIVSPFDISVKMTEMGITISVTLGGTSDYNYTFTR
ncbi:MAG: fibronectin type III domain-containing protein [Clostridia bacterium]|nr:fibronectin type III domain-containing protein [Clostridia bacterium]